MTFEKKCCATNNYTIRDISCDGDINIVNDPKFFHLDGRVPPVSCQLNEWRSIGNKFAIAKDRTLWSLYGDIGAGHLWLNLPTLDNYYQISPDTDWDSIIPGTNGCPDLFCKLDSTLWTFNNRYGLSILDGGLNQKYGYNFPILKNNNSFDTIFAQNGKHLGALIGVETLNATFPLPSREGQGSFDQGRGQCAYRFTFSSAESSFNPGDSIRINVPENVTPDIWFIRDGYPIINFIVHAVVSNNQIITVVDAGYFNGPPAIGCNYEAYIEGFSVNKLLNRRLRLYPVDWGPISFDEFPEYSIPTERARAKLNSSVQSLKFYEDKRDINFYNKFLQEKNKPPTYLDTLKFSRKPTAYIKYYRPSPFNISNSPLDSDGFYHTCTDYIRDDNKTYYHRPDKDEAVLTVSWSGYIDWVRVLDTGSKYSNSNIPEIGFRPKKDEDDYIWPDITVSGSGSFNGKYHSVIRGLYLQDNPLTNKLWWIKSPGVNSGSGFWYLSYDDINNVLYYLPNKSCVGLPEGEWKQIPGENVQSTIDDLFLNGIKINSFAEDPYLFPTASVQVFNSGVAYIDMINNPTVWKADPDIIVSVVPTGIIPDSIGGFDVLYDEGSGAIAACEIIGGIDIILEQSGNGYTHAGDEYSKLVVVIQPDIEDLYVHGIPEFFTPTPTVTPSETPTNTPTPTNTSSNTPTKSITPTITTTKTHTPTLTSTPSFTPTNTVTKTITPTQTVSFSETPTPTASLTASPTVTPTLSKTPIATVSKSIVTNIVKIGTTPNNSPTPTSTQTPNASASPINYTYLSLQTNTPSITHTKTQSNLPTFTPTNTLSPTPITPTPTPSYSPTNTVTPSITPSNSFTPSITPTKSYTPTPSNTNTPVPTITPSLTSVIEKNKYKQWRIADIELGFSEIDKIEITDILFNLNYQLDESIYDINFLNSRYVGLTRANGYYITYPWFISDLELADEVKTFIDEIKNSPDYKTAYLYGPGKKKTPINNSNDIFKDIIIPDDIQNNGYALSRQTTDNIRLIVEMEKGSSTTYSPPNICNYGAQSFYVGFGDIDEPGWEIQMGFSNDIYIDYGGRFFFNQIDGTIWVSGNVSSLNGAIYGTATVYPDYYMTEVGPMRPDPISIISTDQGVEMLTYENATDYEKERFWNNTPPDPNLPPPQTTSALFKIPIVIASGITEGTVGLQAYIKEPFGEDDSKSRHVSIRKKYRFASSVSYYTAGEGEEQIEYSIFDWDGIGAITISEEKYNGIPGFIRMKTFRGATEVPYDLLTSPTGGLYGGHMYSSLDFQTWNSKYLEAVNNGASTESELNNYRIAKRYHDFYGPIDPDVLGNHIIEVEGGYRKYIDGIIERDIVEDAEFLDIPSELQYLPYIDPNDESLSESEKIFYGQPQSVNFYNNFTYTLQPEGTGTGGCFYGTKFSPQYRQDGQMFLTDESYNKLKNYYDTIKPEIKSVTITNNDKYYYSMNKVLKSVDADNADMIFSSSMHESAFIYFPATNTGPGARARFEHKEISADGTRATIIDSAILTHNNLYNKEPSGLMLRESYNFPSRIGAYNTHFPTYLNVSGIKFSSVSHTNTLRGLGTIGFSDVVGGKTYAISGDDEFYQIEPNRLYKKGHAVNFNMDTQPISSKKYANTNFNFLISPPDSPYGYQAAPGITDMPINSYSSIIINNKLDNKLITNKIGLNVMGQGYYEAPEITNLGFIMPVGYTPGQAEPIPIIDSNSAYYQALRASTSIEPMDIGLTASLSRPNIAIVGDEIGMAYNENGLLREKYFLNFSRVYDRIDYTSPYCQKVTPLNPKKINLLVDGHLFLSTRSPLFTLYNVMYDYYDYPSANYSLSAGLDDGKYAYFGGFGGLDCFTDCIIKYDYVKNYPYFRIVSQCLPDELELFYPNFRDNNDGIVIPIKVEADTGSKIQPGWGLCGSYYPDSQIETVVYGSLHVICGKIHRLVMPYGMFSKGFYDQYKIYFGGDDGSFHELFNIAIVPGTIYYNQQDLNIGFKQYIDIITYPNFLTVNSSAAFVTELNNIIYTKIYMVCDDNIIRCYQFPGHDIQDYPYIVCNLNTSIDTNTVNIFHKIVNNTITTINNKVYQIEPIDLQVDTL